MHIAICGEVIFLLVSYSTELSKFTFSAFANYKYRERDRQRERRKTGVHLDGVTYVHLYCV